MKIAPLNLRRRLPPDAEFKTVVIGCTMYLGEKMDVLKENFKNIGTIKRTWKS